MRPLLKQSQRLVYEDIIGDTSLFDSDYIYRPNDRNFGLQKQMQMLLYSGIETKTAQYYVSAFAKNIKRKKYRLGDIKTAVAKTPGTQTVVYEVLYVEVIDPADSENGDVRTQFRIKNNQKNLANTVRYDVPGSSADNNDPSILTIGTRRFGDVNFSLLPSLTVDTRTGQISVQTRGYVPVGVRSGVDLETSINIGNFEPWRFRPNPENTLKIDSDAITVDGANDEIRYISNISHVRDSIRLIGETEINFLPLWMRTTQPGRIAVQGYTKAIPICYCKPGTSQIIQTALKNRGIKFNQFDFDIDRVVIDSTTGNSNEQYIAFANFKINV